MLELKICKALKKYGMIFVENSGWGYDGIHVEDTTGKPYSWGSLYEGWMKKIPWSQLQVSVPLMPPFGGDITAPTKPTNFTATVVSSTQINLSWTASTDNVGVIGYRVYRNGAQIGTATGTSYSNTGLSPSTSYSFAVAAYDSAGNVSAQSNPMTATTPAAADTQAPTVPVGVTAAAVSSTQINVSWTASTDNVGVGGYKVYINGSLLATTTKTSYSDTALKPATAYAYRVAAFDNAGNTSSQSAAASATTPAAPDTITPTVPTGLTATATSPTQVNLVWTASTDNVAVTGYRIYRNGTQIATSATSSYFNTGLAPSTTYGYTVAAYDAAGNVSAQSAAKSATTPAAVDTTPPTVPSGLSAVATSSTQVNLSWTASTDNVAVAGYRVYQNGAQVATSAITSYSNTGLAPSTTYSYTVVAYDAAGNVSAQSAAKSATTKTVSDTMAPTVPTGLTATAVSSTQVNLSWTAATDNVGVAGYRIYRNGTQIGTPAATSYSDIGLTPATTYTYTIAAYDEAGNVSAPSSSVAITLSDPPVEDKPLALTAPNGGELIAAGSDYVITWTAPDKAVSFTLEYSVDNGTTWWPLASDISGTNYTLTVTKPKRNLKRCLARVTAYDATGHVIGTDVSDGTFTVAVVKVVSPSGTQRSTSAPSMRSSSAIDIQWLTYGTEAPVATARLKFSTNGGRSWRSIASVPGDPESYRWQVPAVKKEKKKSLVRVILKDSRGKTVGVDESEGYFTIQP